MLVILEELLRVASRENWNTDYGWISERSGDIRHAPKTVVLSFEGGLSRRDGNGSLCTRSSEHFKGQILADRDI